MRAKRGARKGDKRAEKPAAERKVNVKYVRLTDADVLRVVAEQRPYETFPACLRRLVIRSLDFFDTAAEPPF
jgi:hypothetical protein